MANGYQGLHVRPRSLHPRRRIAAGAVAATIVLTAAWVAAGRAGNQKNTAQSNRTSGQVFASNGTTTTVEPSPSTDATTTVPDTTIGAAPAGPAPTGRTLRTTKTATAPAGTTRTTGATTATTVKAPPKGIYLPPTAVWTTYSCVANGASGWTLTYDVRFSGGSGWASPGGGNTGTEHLSAAAGSGSASAPRPVSISVAHVRDTVNGVVRTVGLTNATVVHC